MAANHLDEAWSRFLDEDEADCDACDGRGTDRFGEDCGFCGGIGVDWRRA